MERRITYVGLDVHKDTIAVALAEAGKRGELREYSKIANTPAALRTLAAKLASHSWRLRFCYEAGPCGYGIQRQLSEAGHECVVVAPSLISRKPGDRVKTDRRDAINLAKLHRAGELSPVWVPDPAHDMSGLNLTFEFTRDSHGFRTCDYRGTSPSPSYAPSKSPFRASLQTGCIPTQISSKHSCDGGCAGSLRPAARLLDVKAERSPRT
jgi:hypothetical protein